MRRSFLLIPLAFALALIAAPASHAGGFATVGLDSTPAGVAPGQPWKVDITVLQHGRTPLTDVTPKVLISSGGTTREFAAAPTAKPGVYRAEVVFPASGDWRYEVLDGFTDMPHTFPTVQIARSAVAAAAPSPAKPAPPEDGGIAAGWLWGAGAALLLAAGVVAVDRRRRRQGAPQRAPEPA